MLTSFLTPLKEALLQLAADIPIHSCFSNKVNMLKELILYASDSHELVEVKSHSCMILKNKLAIRKLLRSLCSFGQMFVRFECSQPKNKQDGVCYS
jgi:hypothetical protein